MSEENHVKEDGEVASPAPQSSAGFFTSSYEHEIYKKYHQYTLSKQDLIDHDYPMSDDEDRADFVQVGNDESIPKSLAESILAIDCEMVVSEAGFQLAKISIVDFNFNSIYDHYIKPTNVITDYNTKYSGITKAHMDAATKTLADMQADLQKLIPKHAILIGHSLENDLNVMKIIHSKVIDTSVIYLNEGGAKSSLKSLAFKYLHLKIQEGSHDSMEDAKVAMALAKYKIDVIHPMRINPSGDEEDSGSGRLEILKSIIEARAGVAVLDKQKYIKPMLKAGVHIDNVEKVEEGIVKLKSWMTRLKTNSSLSPQILCTRYKFKAQENTAETGKANQQALFEDLNKHLEDLYSNAEANTFFMVIFHQPSQRTRSTKTDNNEDNGSNVDESVLLRRLYKNTDMAFMYSK